MFSQASLCDASDTGQHTNTHMHTHTHSHLLPYLIEKMSPSGTIKIVIVEHKEANAHLSHPIGDFLATVPLLSYRKDPDDSRAVLNS